MAQRYEYLKRWARNVEVHEVRTWNGDVVKKFAIERAR